MPTHFVVKDCPCYMLMREPVSVVSNVTYVFGFEDKHGAERNLTFFISECQEKNVEAYMYTCTMPFKGFANLC